METTLHSQYFPYEHIATKFEHFQVQHVISRDRNHFVKFILAMCVNDVIRYLICIYQKPEVSRKKYDIE